MRKTHANLQRGISLWILKFEKKVFLMLRIILEEISKGINVKSQSPFFHIFASLAEKLRISEILG